MKHIKEDIDTSKDPDFKRLQLDKMPTYCAWCKKHMYGLIGDYDTASHGLCPDCLEKVKAEYAQQKEFPLRKESVGSFKEFLAQKLFSV